MRLIEIDLPTPYMIDGELTLSGLLYCIANNYQFAKTLLDLINAMNKPLHSITEGSSGTIFLSKDFKPAKSYTLSFNYEEEE